MFARVLRRGDTSDGAVRRSRRKAGRNREPHTGFDPHSPGDDYDVNDLGGVFAPKREMPGAELSIDMSVLSGLRATYESTMDGLAPSADTGIMDTEGGLDPGAADAEPVEPAAAAEQLALDLSRPIAHLLLLARHGRLSGHAILEAFDAEGFRPGAMQLYYRLSEQDPSISFGVANLVEPGALDPGALSETETPGLVVFMCIPDDAAQAREILDAMIAASRRLAHRLDTALCDETRSTLSTQAENHLREKVMDIARRSRLKG